MVYDDYTLDELHVHHEAVLRRQADERKEHAVLLRNAANAKARAFKKYLRQLEETGVRIDKATGQFKTTADNLSGDLARLQKTVEEREARKRGKKPDAN